MFVGEFAVHCAQQYFSEQISGERIRVNRWNRVFFVYTVYTSPESTDIPHPFAQHKTPTQMPPPPPTLNLTTLFYQFLSTRIGTVSLYALLLVIGYPIEQIAFPELYGRIVDVIAKPSTLSLWQRTWTYLLIATVLLIVSQAIFTWADYLDAYLQPALESYFRERVLNEVLSTIEQRYKDVEVGEVVSKLSKLPLVIRHIYHQVRAYLLPAILVAVFACGYFMYLHWGLGVMLLVVLVFFFVFFGWKASTCIPASQKRDAMCDSLNDGIDDTLNNLLSVYTATNVRREQQRFQHQQRRHDQQYTKSAMCGVTFKAWYSVFYIGIFILINGYAFYLTHEGTLAIGQLVSVVFVTLYMIGNIGDFAGEIKDFMFDLGIMAEMQRYLDGLFAFGQHGPATLPPSDRSTRTPLTQAPLTHHPFHIPNGTIRFHNVRFRYPNTAQPALRDTSFTIPAGTSVALVGKIGSGKSTVTKLLCGCTPLKPAVSLLMALTSPIPQKTFVRALATWPKPLRCSTEPSTTTLSTEAKPPSKRDVALYIEHSGIAPLFETVRHGLDTHVGKRGEHLSGGQRQAVALLRMALSGHRDTHRVLLLDEPTSALDHESKHYVMRLMRRLMTGRTCVVVTHDEEVVRMLGECVGVSGEGGRRW